MRSRIFMVLLLVTIFCNVQSFAYSGTIDSSYQVGTSNTTQFSAVADKLPFGTSYVYWRSGQYTYQMAYGEDMTLEGTTFSAPKVTLITYTTASGYQSQATWEVDEEMNFTLTANNYMVWSDLGDYPDFTERGVRDYAKLSCIILASFALYYLFHHLWGDIRQRYLGG